LGIKVVITLLQTVFEPQLYISSNTLPYHRDKTEKLLFEIWGFHEGDDIDDVLLGLGVVWTG
jgi:hypothetical protein